MSNKEGKKQKINLTNKNNKLWGLSRLALNELQRTVKYIQETDIDNLFQANEKKISISKHNMVAECHSEILTNESDQNKA